MDGRLVPIWVADYVLMDYGTGAVMAVPCGDQRDFEFARQYGLPIIPVVVPAEQVDAVSSAVLGTVPQEVDWTEAYAGPGVMVNSGAFDGMAGGKDSEGMHAVAAWLASPRRGARERELPVTRLAHQQAALLG